jgi:DNA-binding SARP family transcriptional activator/tetratricopeptide (TPR) repeat protein
VEFGLLGPLLVRSGDTPIQVSAGKQRVLLAVLLLHANQVVAADDLASAIWQDNRPETARVTLQNYVMRLRHSLGPAGYERIVSRPSGYLIEVHRGELDVAQFVELHGAGLAAARAGAWEDASGQLAEALRLWRGKPLADVPSPLLAAEVSRLAEMRLVALETRIDADLHLYRHHELIPELGALATAEPLRERLHELLMVALYRSGQQAAALAAYRHARRQLVDELGIEPGPALRELNQRIRQSGRTLPIQPRPGGGTPQDSESKPGPSMLPVSVPGFTGRDAELRALSAMLPGAAPGPVLITAVGGTAGVGKTALAVQWAREHAADFPGGQLYVNLRGFGPAGPLSSSEALRIFLDALAVPFAGTAATLDGLVALYRSRLAGSRTLILLDNARDPDQVRPLLPDLPGCMVIVTSRNELTGLIAAEGAHTITLDVLTTGAARQLLTLRLGPERVAAEPGAVAELISLCARLPLALAIAAARATARPGFPLAAQAAELRDARSRLDALGTGEESTDVRTVFSWSYHQLSPAAARMFRMLGLHPGPEVTAPAAASLAAITLPETRAALRELSRVHMLTEQRPGRYTFHDLLRAYAAEQAKIWDGQAERDAAVSRVLLHYLHTAHAAALLLTPRRDPIIPEQLAAGVNPEHLTSYRQALAWFEAEHRVLLASVRQAAQARLDRLAWQLAWAMQDFLDRRGHWHELPAVGRIALDAATRLGDAAGQAVAHRLAALACHRLDDYQQARVHLMTALSLYRQLGDRLGEARIYQSLSIISDRGGDLADALGHDKQALSLFRAIGHRSGQAYVLNSIGWSHILLGKPEHGRLSCQESLALHRELGDRAGEAYAWDSLGYAEHQLSRFTRAADCYQQALMLLRELGDRYQQADTLRHLADACRSAGDLTRARHAWQQALAILDDLHHPDADHVRAKLSDQGRLRNLAAGRVDRAAAGRPRARSRPGHVTPVGCAALNGRIVPTRLRWAPQGRDGECRDVLRCSRSGAGGSGGVRPARSAGGAGRGCAGGGVGQQAAGAAGGVAAARQPGCCHRRAGRGGMGRQPATDGAGDTAELR